MSSIEVLRTYDLHPDGVKISVSWDDMLVSTSIFVPCINTEEAKKQVKQVFLDKKWSFLTRISIENGFLGLRVWRTM
jgi:adenosine deaminase